MRGSDRRGAGALLAFLLFSSSLLAQPAAKPADELDAQLDRIFNKKAYEAKTFGPARWIEDGEAYTTVEPAAAAGARKDIVRYDAATGARSVLVSAARARAPPARRPARDRRLRLVGRRPTAAHLHQHAERCGAQNTRGDYWVLDLADAARSRKLGGDAPESRR